MVKSLRLISFFLFGCLLVVFSYLSTDFKFPLYSASNSVWFEKYLTNRLHQPVTIEQLSIHWRGIAPIVDIDNLKILDNKSNSTALQIKHLHFETSLFASLIKWKIIPSQLEVQGLQLVLKELGNGKVDINGIPFLEANLKAIDSEKLDYLLSCFLTAGYKKITDLEITWYDQTGRLILPLTKLNFLGQSHWLYHSYEGSALLWNKAPLIFKGRLLGSLVATDWALSKTKVKLDSIPLQEQFWLKQYFGVALLAGSAQADFEVSTQPSLVKLDGLLKARDVNLQMRTDKTYPITSLATHFRLQQSNKGLNLSLTNLQLYLAKHLLPTHKLNFEQIQRGKAITRVIQIDQFQIASVIHFLLENNFLPPSWISSLLHLKPSGQVTHFYFESDLTNKLQPKIKGLVSNFNLLPWQQIPGISHLTGELAFFPKKGSLNLNSVNTTLTYQPMFRFPITFKKMTGIINWQGEINKKLRVKLKNLYLESDIGQASGSLNLLLPKDKQKTYINSTMQFKLYDLAKISRVYPVALLPNVVLKWLDNSIQGGVAQSGLFVLKGYLKDFPFDHRNGKFLIRTDISQGHLHYLEGWPDLTNLQANVQFEGRQMAIVSRNAFLLGAKVKNLSVTINDLAKAVLKINGKLDSRNESRLHQQNNPLFSDLKLNFLKDLIIKGKWQLGLKLVLPLDKDQLLPEFAGNLNLQDAKLMFSDLSVEAVTGKLSFTENSLKAQRVRGMIDSCPFQLTSTLADHSGANFSDVNLTGKINISTLKKIFDHPILSALSGSANYQVGLTLFPLPDKSLNTAIRPTSMSSVLAINSDLKGLESTLPSPFNKQANDSLPVQFKLEQTDSLREINFSLAEKIKTKLHYKLQTGETSFDRGILQINDPGDKLLPTSGMMVVGHLAEFDWPLWQQLLNNKNDQATTWQPQLNGWQSRINSLNLQIDALKLPGFDLKAVNLRAFSNQTALSILIDSNLVRGDIQFPYFFPANPLRITLQSLNLQNQSSLENNLQPKDIPPLDLSINNFQYKDKLINFVDLKLRPKGNSLIIKQLVIKNPSLELNASGIWQSINGYQATNLIGSLTTNDLGTMLNQWQFTDNVVKGKGQAQFNLTWANSPFKPESKTLEGLANIEFNQGRISKLGGQANFGMGIGRILTLFSLQTLPRRLMFDFSDLTEPGFSFDKLKGKFRFNKGNLFTDDFALDGPVAKVKINGRIGLAAKDYNLKLIINPNVTSSLPIVAALTAGPLAGAATWLVDKVVSHQVKRLTEIHYNVTGTWDKPNLENSSNSTSPNNDSLNKSK